MNNLIDIFKIIIQAGVIGGILTYMKDNKSNELSHITSERKEWRKDIRNIADELDKSVFLTDILNILSKLKTRINQYGMNYIYKGNKKDNELAYLKDEHIWEKIDEIELINQIDELKVIICDSLNEFKKCENNKKINDLKNQIDKLNKFLLEIDVLNIYIQLKDYDNISKSKNKVCNLYNEISKILDELEKNKLKDIKDDNLKSRISTIKNKLQNIKEDNFNYLTSKNKIVKYLHLMLKHDWERSKQEVIKNRILFVSAISYGISMLFYYINDISQINNNIILDLLKNIYLYGITLIVIIVFSSKVSSIGEFLLLNLLFFVNTKNAYSCVVIVMLFIIEKFDIVKNVIIKKININNLLCLIKKKININNLLCLIFIIIFIIFKFILYNKCINFEVSYDELSEFIFFLPYLLLFYYSYLEYKLNNDYKKEIDKIK